MKKCLVMMMLVTFTIIAGMAMFPCHVNHDSRHGNGGLHASMWTQPIDENFESSPDTTLATDVPLFSAGAGHDVDGNIIAQVALDGSDHVLNLTDKDIDKNYEIIKNLRHDYLVGENLSFDIKPFTTSSSTCSFEIIYIDGITNITRLKIHQDNASISYYDAAWHSSGISITLDSWQTVAIEFTSTSAFKLKIGVGSWSSAFSNENAITGVVDGIEFISPTDNGGAPVSSYVVDDFESPWAVSDVLTGSKRSGTWTNTGSNTHTIISGQYGHIITDAGYGDDKVVFQDSGSIVASDYIEWKINPAETTKTIYLRIANDASETHGIVMMLTSDGQVYIWSGGVSSAITTYTASWHTMRVIFNSQTSWSLKLDATTYGPYSPNDGAMDHVYSVDYMGGANTGTFDLDDIITSWAQGSTPGLVAPVKTCLDDIGIDMAARFASNATAIIGGQSIAFAFTGITGNGVMDYQWSCGDGTANETVQNPVHKYLAAGMMDVILTITDADGDISVKRELSCVTVALDLFPSAAFTQNGTSITEGDSINFTCVGSVGNAPASYQWDFGDGSANSTAMDPLHKFTVAGVFNITVTITDFDGDASTVTFYNMTVTADLTPPVTMISFTPAFAPDFVNITTSFTFAAADNPGGSGVASTWFKCSGAFTRAWGLYIFAFTLSTATNGTVTIEYCSIDNAGNNESLQSSTVRIDSFAPNTTLSCIPVHAPDFIRSTTPITLAAADDPGGSGVASTWYKFPGQPWMVYTGAFTLAGKANGSYTIQYCSIDNVGNNETLHSMTVRIDTIAPSTTISCTPVLVNGSGTWVNSSTLFTLAASDNAGGSGIAKIRYKIDTGPWTTYTGRFSLGSSSDETRTIYYLATDNVGNAQVLASIDVLVAVIVPPVPIPDDPPWTIIMIIAAIIACASIAIVVTRSIKPARIRLRIRPVMKPATRRVLELSAAMAMIAGITFFLANALSIDAIDDLVKRDLQATTYADISIVNATLSIYLVGLLGCSMLAAVIVFQNATALETAVRSAAFALLVMYVTAGVGLLPCPGWTLTFSNWILVPVLYATYVLRSFMWLVAIVFIAYAGATIMFNLPGVKI
jgi:PKD repeat protein